jgi:hypothetical protein
MSDITASPVPITAEQVDVWIVQANVYWTWVMAHREAIGWVVSTALAIFYGKVAHKQPASVADAGGLVPFIISKLPFGKK